MTVCVCVCVLVCVFVCHACACECDCWCASIRTNITCMKAVMYLCSRFNAICFASRKSLMTACRVSTPLSHPINPECGDSGTTLESKHEKENNFMRVKFQSVILCVIISKALNGDVCWMCMCALCNVNPTCSVEW